MKKLVSSLSRLNYSIVILFLVFSISNSCTKTVIDESGFVPAQGPSEFSVIIQSRFNPAEIKISAGNIVTWTYEGSSIESITSDDGLIDGIVGTNETYSFKFTSAGTYIYHSRIHPNLIGKVVVDY